MPVPPASPADDRTPAAGLLRREAARVLPVDPAGRVLLLQARNPQWPGPAFWFTVGGALDPGETPVEGAIRELREETGIELAAAQLGEPFGRGTVRFAWDGRDILQEQTYFAVAVPDATVSFAGHDEWERATLVGYAWWSPGELQASGATTTPGLAALMRRAIAHVGGDPAHPLGDDRLTAGEGLALRGSGWRPGGGGAAGGGVVPREYPDPVDAIVVAPDAPVLVDATAWIELLRATGSAVDRRLGELLEAGARLAVCDLVVMKVLAGAGDDARRDRLRRLLAGCAYLETQAPADHERAADLYRACHAAGHKVRRLPECLIAVVAMRHGVALLHADEDFEQIARCAPLSVLSVGR